MTTPENQVAQTATNALTVAAQAQLINVPEHLREGVQSFLTQNKSLIPALAYAGAELLATCDSPAEVADLLRELSISLQTDQQAPFEPPVFTIDHKMQRWQDPDGNNAGGSINVVVLYWQPTRAFFVDGQKLPLCSAVGTHDTGRAAADAQSRWLQHKLGDKSLVFDWEGREKKCSECPFNNFGSDPKTGSGKACKEKYRVFVMLVDDKGNLIEEGAMFNVPSTSMKNWNRYVSQLLRAKPQRLTSPQVVTNLALGKAEGQGQTYSVIEPKAASVLNPADQRTVFQIRKHIMRTADQLGVEVGEYKNPEDGGLGSEYKQDDEVPF